MIYDVIVVGGGIAGLMAAIEAKDEQNRVALITKGNLFKSNSSMAILLIPQSLLLVSPCVRDKASLASTHPAHR